MQVSEYSLYVMSLFTWYCFTVDFTNKTDQDQNGRLTFAVLLQLPKLTLVFGAVYAVLCNTDTMPGQLDFSGVAAH